MEQKIIFATGNENKMKEIRMILADLGMPILSMKEAGIDVDVVDDGTTFEENALIKATEIAKLTENCIVLADDSGLEIDYLNKEPGIYSARYAGEHGNDDENIKKLLAKLEGVTDRSAHFVSSIAFCQAGGDSFVLRGEAYGTILYEKRGDNGFGYDPVFECAHHHRSYAELTAEEKNTVSHRRRAIEKLADRLFNKK